MKSFWFMKRKLTLTASTALIHYFFSSPRTCYNGVVPQNTVWTPIIYCIPHGTQETTLRLSIYSSIIFLCSNDTFMDDEILATHARQGECWGKGFQLFSNKSFEQAQAWYAMLTSCISSSCISSSCIIMDRCRKILLPAGFFFFFAFLLHASSWIDTLKQRKERYCSLLCRPTSPDYVPEENTY